MSVRIPAVVLGGTGYVAGELLRLLAGHPRFEVRAVMSDSQPGEPIGAAFPHLAAIYGSACFRAQSDVEALLTDAPQSALFGAAPHGVSARLIDAMLTVAEAAGTRVRAVDISADFRFRSSDAYQQVYGHPQGAPRRLAQFSCAVPEHLAELATPHVAHPGCFASAVLLAGVPLLQLNLSAPQLFVSGVTGSTGSGRKPVAGTHHPLRHSDLYAYSPLAHRHAPEIAACIHGATGVAADIAFVPHSGPFARGIHVTVQSALARRLDTAAILGALREFYAGSPFVRVLDTPPRVKDIVASNYAHLSATSDGRTVAVMCTLDNLTKGAAGGAIQWMNRLFGLAQTEGLTAPAPGWT